MGRRGGVRWPEDDVERDLWSARAVVLRAMTSSGLSGRHTADRALGGGLGVDGKREGERGRSGGRGGEQAGEA